jgi:outer membrane immunogenic protein
VRRLLLFSCICALTLVAGTAVNAQSKDKDPWNGFYVGGYAGGTFGTMNAHTTTIFSPTGYFAASSVPAIATAGAQNVTMNGFNGGGQIGYSHTEDHLMIGVEVDFGSSSITGSQSTTAVYPCCGPTAFTVKQTGTTKWMATARPRVGYARGRFLYYGTFGIAMADLNYREVFTDTFATAAENGGITKNKFGWVGGGGVEYSFGHHWSLKGEYLYAHFQNETAFSTNLTAFTGPVLSFPSNFFVHSANLQGHTVRAGVNYTF